MNIPGFDFHSLSGRRKGTDMVHVNGPWCITVGWDGTDASAADAARHIGSLREPIDVDFDNYHEEMTPLTQPDPNRPPVHPGAILREDTDCLGFRCKKRYRSWPAGAPDSLLPPASQPDNLHVRTGPGAARKDFTTGGLRGRQGVVAVRQHRHRAGAQF
jgi:hypothetical protein